MSRHTTNNNQFNFWTPPAVVLSFVPTIFTYFELFDDGERGNKDFGKKYVENFWLRQQHPAVKPLCYLGASILLLLTVPISLFLLTISLPISLLHDFITACDLLLDACLNESPSLNP